MSDDGKISWRVPDAFEDDLVFVILTLTTDDGQTAFHTLRLQVRG